MDFAISSGGASTAGASAAPPAASQGLSFIVDEPIAPASMTAPTRQKDDDDLLRQMANATAFMPHAQQSCGNDMAAAIRSMFGAG